MAESRGAESERCIVLVVVERDGSLVLVVEPTRAAVLCPRCGELSRVSIVATNGTHTGSALAWANRADACAQLTVVL